MARWTILMLLALSACAPDQVGQQVGQSLYDASVNTGHALATFGDQTGQALQDAGTNLRGTFNPPGPGYPPPLGLPPPYVPDGYTPQDPITAEPLAPPSGAPGEDATTPPNPALGY